MKSLMKKALCGAILSCTATGALAGEIGIYEFSSFINADEIAGDSLIDRQLHDPGLPSLNEFGSAGLSVSFVNNLNVDNIGTVSWTITNNSGSDLNNVQFFGFLDAEIDESLNTFFNESGDESSLLLGAGSGDALADSWGIGDPFFDDIFNDLLDANLTNTNTVPSGSESDVSLALGFDIGTLGVGESFGVMFDIALADNNGLQHFDQDSDDGDGFAFYFNGAVLDDAAPVSEAASFPLLVAGLLSMGLVSRRKKERMG